MSVVDMPGDDILASSLDSAEALLRSGDAAGALAAYDDLLDIHGHVPAALLGRAAALRALGRKLDALKELIPLAEAGGTRLEAQRELGLVLADLGRKDQSRAIFTLLLRHADAPAAAWRDFAALLLKDGNEAAAEAALRRAVLLNPTDIHSRRLLGDVLSNTQDFAGAVDLYQDILAIAPRDVDTLASLGHALIGLGRLEEAEDQLERALAINGDHPRARLGRARLNLLEGFPQGAWEDLEWRWRLTRHPRPEAPGQTWDGNTDLAGATILLWAEQSLVEIVHLLRYVPLVADTGATIVLAVPESLLDLARTVDGADHVIASGSALPVPADFNASLSDLPRLFATSLSGIPPAPYLGVPAGRRPKVTASPNALLKVGLVWAGRRVHWNVPLHEIMALLALPDAAFFSLQMGEPAKTLAAMAHPSLVTDLSPTMGDYADLAGRIAEMDLVITVDAEAAHIAGAMGKAVWVLLPYAPDWRWMLNRDDTPWYGSARLFRQDRPGDWTGAITRLLLGLEDLLAQERQRRLDAARAQDGPKAAQRAFLSTHLRPGDLLVDAGSGDGVFAMDAATHPCGDVRVLAIEARRTEADILADTVAISGLDGVIEVVCAPLSGRCVPAVVSKAQRLGRTVFTLPDWVRAPVETMPLDVLLADRPDLSERRLVIRLGAKGAEAEVLDGLWEALTFQRAALVVFEHREGGQAASMLEQAGYALYRFPTDIAAGPVADFAGEPGMVLALSPDTEKLEVYGDGNDTTSPAAMARAADQAQRLAREGAAKLAGNHLNSAGELFARALVADGGNVIANVNLGVLLRRIGRAHAAIACWRRALSRTDDPAVRGNLANGLREVGALEEAEAEFLKAVAARPEDTRLLLHYALLERQRGRAKESLGLLERAEHLSAGSVPRAELAASLLKSGNLARGMAEMFHRPRPQRAHPDVPVWDGGRLHASTILVQDEGDDIDTIMLARFIPQVARQGGLVIVECSDSAARLMGALPGVEAAIPRGADFPEVDLRVDLMDVPRLLGTTSRTTPPRDVPYLYLPEDVAALDLDAGNRLKVGVAWAGRDRDRPVPLAEMLRLTANPDTQFYSLQRGPRAADLAESGARPFMEDLGKSCTDLAETAAAIAGLDLIIAADTVEAHMAGAMGKTVWVLLPLGNDWRWVDHRDDSVWYPTMRVFRQSPDGTWSRAIARMTEALDAMALGRRR